MVWPYLGDGVHGHQPGDETLVPGDVGQHWGVAVADGDRPGHAWIEVIVHADCQSRWLGRRAGQGHSLRGVAIPRVADAVRVADGLHPTLSQLW